MADTMTNDDEDEDEDANETSFRVIQQATGEGEKPDSEAQRCTYLWLAKSCKLGAGHFDTHQFDI